MRILSVGVGVLVLSANLYGVGAIVRSLLLGISIEIAAALNLSIQIILATVLMLYGWLAAFIVTVSVMALVVAAYRCQERAVGARLS
ncbi:hypothetical protein [Streptomyces sp. x-80]|uniref:hypothetical protein n=1 Tax=Streptomyces sp. x-80 TaxID=2789282 RepID=UPI003980CC44